MSLCINPNCQQAQKEIDQGLSLFCSGCGSPLIINDCYRVERRLGKGGFGVTYLVSDAGTPKVLKVLLQNPDPNFQKKAIELFEQEARVLQRLNHVGIPKVEPDSPFLYHPNGSAPLYCLVMECIEGEDLEGYMKKRNFRPISEKAAIRWLRELVEILDVVHGANYFHRDIKPPNIMIRKSGQLALIDFGTAREETQTYFQKQKGQGVTGIVSAGYTPHEQANGQAESRSDFFALGRTFIFLLTGKSPHLFSDSLKRGLQWQHEAQGYSQQFRNFLDELMRPDVGDRPKNTKAIFSKLLSLAPQQSEPFPVWLTGIVVLCCTAATFACFSSDGGVMGVFVGVFFGLFLGIKFAWEERKVGWARIVDTFVAVTLGATVGITLGSAVVGSFVGVGDSDWRHLAYVGLFLLVSAFVGFPVAFSVAELSEALSTKNFLLTVLGCVLVGLLCGWWLHLAFPLWIPMAN